MHEGHEEIIFNKLYMKFYAECNVVLDDEIYRLCRSWDAAHTPLFGPSWWIGAPFETELIPSNFELPYGQVSATSFDGLLDVRVARAEARGKLLFRFSAVSFREGIRVECWSVQEVR
jgi:hypothetical protein